MLITGDKLEFFKGLLARTKASLSVLSEDLDRRKKQYEGDAEIDGSPEKASSVWNITYEIIESKVNTNIPMPKVTPRRRTVKTERNARSVERLLYALRDALPTERMNDVDERNAYVYGASIWLAEWDNSIVTHNTVGDVRLSLVNPQFFYPQPNVYRVEDMEYLFVRFDTAKSDLVRRYGVTYEQTDLAGAEADVGASECEETVTVYVCYYKDDSDNVCVFAWSDELVLEDVTDYYARKTQVCKACGKRKELCKCENPKFESISEEAEELDGDVQLTNSKVIRERDPATGEVTERVAFETIPGKTPVLNKDGTIRTTKKTVSVPVVDADGSPVMDEATGLPLVEVREVDEPVMRATVIPYYKPKTFPVIVRTNISRSDCLFGQSDCDVIREQQQNVNKLKSRIFKKLMRSSVTPIVPEDAKLTLDNGIFGQVIKLQAGQSPSMFGTVDTTPRITEEVTQCQIEYENAKRIVGITESFQGNADSTATSGKAKQIQVAQSAGRIESTRRMKQAAWADIDRAIFELYLAYSDEPRPLAYRDEYGALQNVQFNRYDFLELDEQTLEWYYDDQYLFSTDKSGADDIDNASKWQMQTQDYASGLYGQPGSLEALLQLWMMRERTHYPNARHMVERVQEQIRAAIKAAQKEESNAGNEARTETV